MPRQFKSIAIAAGLFLVAVAALIYQQRRFAQARAELDALRQAQAGLQGRLSPGKPKAATGIAALAQMFKAGGRNHLEIVRDAMDYEIGRAHV